MLAEGTELGGFRVDRLIGQGGMGTVYEATQLSLRRTVALKVLSPALSGDDEFRERFRREALLQAGLDHDHVVAVYEAGEADHWLYIVMRLIHGPSLKELVRAGGLDAARVLRLLTPIADALDTAHEAGLIHRDVKPHNVLVGPRDHAYLSDFGLTKGPDQTALTTAGRFMGTLDYTAPEQIRGEEVSRASDLYSLAASVYECLTGTVPFRRDSEAAIVYAHLSGQPPRASEVCPELPRELDDVLAKGLAKEPSGRQPSAGALMREVEDALGGTAPTIAAAPLARAARPRAPRPVRRRLSFIAAGCALAALLVGVLLVAIGGDGDGPSDGSPQASATVTLGSALAAAGQTVPCLSEGEGTCTLLQTDLSGQPLRAPFDGVVTRWRVRSARGTVALQVIEGSDRRAATSVTEPVEVRGQRISAFPASLPIGRGDSIGLLVEEGGRLGMSTSPQSRFVRFSPPLGPRARPLAGGDPGPGPPNYEVLVNADVEPDEDGDGRGDVTQN